MRAAMMRLLRRASAWNPSGASSAGIGCATAFEAWLHHRKLGRRDASVTMLAKTVTMDGGLVELEAALGEAGTEFLVTVVAGRRRPEPTWWTEATASPTLRSTAALPSSPRPCWSRSAPP